MTTTLVRPNQVKPSTAPSDELRLALSSGARPPQPSALSASVTFGWRAMLKIKHVPEQLFDVTAFPIMFTLMFTFLFGGALAGSTREYAQFLLPGILVQSILTITVYTGVGLNTDIQRGTFDRFRSLPIWRPSTIVGMLLGDAARYTIASTIIIMLGLLLGFRPDGGVVGVLASILLLLVFAFSLSWVWMILGMKMRTPNAVMGVSMMLLFPLTFISNIFVDPATMPSWLRAFVNVNPVSFLVGTSRELMAGTASATDVIGVLLISAAIVAVFGPLTMYTYRTRQ